VVDNNLMQMADRICTLRCGWHHRALPAYEIPPAMPGDYYFDAPPEAACAKNSRKAAVFS
ncbi:MAG: hypothetical protein ACOX65_14085, partial [Anaerotruncus rubiinfantis]